MKKFTINDGEYIQRYVPLYLDRIREDMEKSCNYIKPLQKTCVLPQALRGHIFELNVAAQNTSQKEVLKEIDEILETVDDFMKYARDDRFQF